MSNGLPFRPVAETRHPRALSEMTKEEFDARMAEGLTQAKAGEGIPASEFFASIKKELMDELKNPTAAINLNYAIEQEIQSLEYNFMQGAWMIDGYLGYFFIRKCMWLTPGNIKGTAASIKKFYRCMLKHEMIQEADYEYLCKTIKEKMQKWQETCALYNEPDKKNPFALF